MPRKAGRRKKKRTHAVDNENGVGALTSQETLKVLKSLVVCNDCHFFMAYFMLKFQDFFHTTYLSFIVDNDIL